MENENQAPRPKRLEKIVRLDGQTFGLLTVLHREGRAGRYVAWRCRCSCGAEVVVSGKELRRRKKRACGVNGHRFGKGTPTGFTVLYPSEYSSWSNMHQRCTNSKL